MRLSIDTTTLVALLLVSSRILAWSLVAPPVATAGVPATIKTVLSVALALPLLPAARVSGVATVAQVFQSAVAGSETVLAFCPAT